MARRDLGRWLVAGLCGLMPACLNVSKDGGAVPVADRVVTPAGEPAVNPSPYSSLPRLAAPPPQPAYRTAAVAAAPRAEPGRMALDPSAVPELPPTAVDGGTGPVEDPVLAAAANPTGLTEPALVMVLRAYLDRRPDEALELLKQYDQPNQDLLLCLLPMVVRLTEGSLRQADPHELEVMVEQLQGVLTPLRPRAALKIDRLCFCRPTERGVESLDAGHPQHPGELVYLCVKPRNFTTVPLRPDGKPADGPGCAACYTVPLVSTLAIETADGRRLGWQQVVKQDRPLPTPPLPHDHVQFLQFTLPDDLPPGSYQLLLELVDPPTQRVARGKVKFQVQ
jgi:hypothetical protein